MSQSEKTLTTQDVFLTEKKTNIDPVHLELKSLNDSANRILDRDYPKWVEQQQICWDTDRFNELIKRFAALAA